MIDNAANLNLNQYVGGMHEDGLLLQWWGSLIDSGDMDYVLQNPETTPASFLNYFQPSTQLGYAADDKGIWFAQWFEPWMSGAFVGIWIRDDKRRTKAAALATHLVFTKAFELWPTILAVTKKSVVVGLCESMGFTNMGQLGKIFGGKDAWLLSCEKAAFTGALRNGVKRSQKTQTERITNPSSSPARNPERAI